LFPICKLVFAVNSEIASLSVQTAGQDGRKHCRAGINNDLELTAFKQNVQQKASLF